MNDEPSRVEIYIRYVANECSHMDNMFEDKPLDLTM